MRQRLYISIFLITIVVVGLGLWKFGAWPFGNAAAQTAGETSTTAPDSSPLPATVKTVVVAWGPVQSSIQLNGQVSWTETGRADVTTPLNGVVVRPLVKIGERVAAGTSLATINNVYGQTTLQLQKQLETDQMSLLGAQNSLQQALTNLGQSNATLASTQTTESQAQDNDAQDRAEVRRARTDLARKRTLVDSGVYAKADLEDAQERWDKAQAASLDATRSLLLAKHGVEIARRNLAPAQHNVTLTEHTVHLAQLQVEHDRVMALGAQNPDSAATSTRFDIKSPIQGVVLALSMSAGQAVSPGTIVATVGDISHVYVDAAAYESDLKGIAVDDPVEVTAPAFAEQRWRGRVKFVGTQVDPTTRTVTVRCDVDNHGGLLKQGLFVTVRLSAPRPRQALLVPVAAILVSGSDYYVVVETAPGHYEKRLVKEGARLDKTVEIIAGVHAGDKVVTSGNVLVMGD